MWTGPKSRAWPGLSTVPEVRRTLCRVLSAPAARMPASSANRSFAVMFYGAEEFLFLFDVSCGTLKSPSAGEKKAEGAKMQKAEVVVSITHPQQPPLNGQHVIQ